VVVVVDVDAAWLELAIDDVAVLVVAAMQPVSTAIAATLSAPAARRVRRAGCGRLRRVPLVRIAAPRSVVCEVQRRIRA
jgi:hypothetical protein